MSDLWHEVLALLEKAVKPFGTLSEGLHVLVVERGRMFIENLFNGLKHVPEQPPVFGAEPLACRARISVFELHLGAPRTRVALEVSLSFRSSGVALTVGSGSLLTALKAPAASFGYLAAACHVGVEVRRAGRH